MTTDGHPSDIPKRRYTKIDPFAVPDFAREHDLTGPESAVLLTVTIQAEFRTGEWAGTLTDLASAVRFSRNVVSRIVKSLVDKSVFAQVHPFGPGHANGRIRVVHFEHFVAPSTRRKKQHQVVDQGPESRDLVAPSSRPVRKDFAQINAIEQGKDHVLEVQRHRGSEGLGGGQDRCSTCDEPIDGHPFNDHEPLAANVLVDEHTPWQVRFGPENDPF